MTLENAAISAKREADKSYKLALNRVRPDLAIEVVFPSYLDSISRSEQLL